MKVHSRDMTKSLFYLVLIVSFSLFAAACASTSMSKSGPSSNILGYFQDTATAILLVGYPIAVALFYIGACLRK